MEDRDVSLSDIETLRNNVAWKFLVDEWEKMLHEVQSTLITEDYPEVYRTQGRASALTYALISLDSLEEIIHGQE